MWAQNLRRLWLDELANLMLLKAQSVCKVVQKDLRRVEGKCDEMESDIGTLESGVGRVLWRQQELRKAQEALTDLVIERFLDIDERLQDQADRIRLVESETSLDKLRDQRKQKVAAGTPCRPESSA